jgi:16S rRNA (guanine(966)-N(2))-methyltransferase RsmD
VRPTASKVRQALFNILGSRIEGARFLDIFAGSGLIGMEALSRGAQSLTAVEENKKMARAIEMNLRNLSLNGKIYSADFRTMLPKLPAKSFDIIFADPPYKTPFGRLVLEMLDQLELLSESGLLVIEHLHDYALPDNLSALEALDKRRYGETALSFYQHRSQL